MASRTRKRRQSGSDSATIRRPCGRRLCRSLPVPAPRCRSSLCNRRISTSSPPPPSVAAAAARPPPPGRHHQMKKRGLPSADEPGMPCSCTVVSIVPALLADSAWHSVSAWVLHGVSAWVCILPPRVCILHGVSSRVCILLVFCARVCAHFAV